MCGRFALTTPLRELVNFFESEPVSDLIPFEPSWNISPQKLLPVLTETGVHGEHPIPRHFRPMRWGFQPSWGTKSNQNPINARRETIQQKPMFRAAFERRRGLVPADGWYEWMTTPQGKTPWFHTRADGEPCGLAVVWDSWTDGTHHMESWAMLTQEANEDCSNVHHRMPVLLERGEVDDWLDKASLPNLPSEGTVRNHPVSREVNRAGVDHAGLIAPLRTLFDQEYGS
jgi:putative SOS response-associated peptidase YedK